MNFASVMIIAVMGYALISWAVSAHKWYHGPLKRVSEEELAEMEAATKGEGLGKTDETVVPAPVEAVDAPVNEITPAQQV